MGSETTRAAGGEAAPGNLLFTVPRHPEAAAAVAGAAEEAAVTVLPSSPLLAEKEALPVAVAAEVARAMLGATRVKADQMPPMTLTAASLSASFLRGGRCHKHRQ